MDLGLDDLPDDGAFFGEADREGGCEFESFLSLLADEPNFEEDGLPADEGFFSGDSLRGGEGFDPPRACGKNIFTMVSVPPPKLAHERRTNERRLGSLANWELFGMFPSR